MSTTTLSDMFNLTGFISAATTITTTNMTMTNISSIVSPTVELSSFHLFLRNLTTNLDMFIVPTLVIVGIIGNGLSFATFTFSSLKKLSSSIYLAALAVADTGFLICVFFSWINNLNVTIYHQPGWCQTFVYLTYVFSFLSVWYVVGFTVERYIAVCYPFKRCDMCTVQRARIVVVGLAILALVGYTFGIWTSGSFLMKDGRRLCYPADAWRDVIEIVNSLDSIITLAVPFIVIAVLNAHIIISVAKYRRQANQMLFYPTTGTQSRVSQLTSNKDGMRVTRMLLVVSFTFLLLNVPGHAIRIDVFVRTLLDSNYRPSFIYRQLQIVFLYIYYFNFSINFILYSLCGKNFRAALNNLLVGCKKVNPREPMLGLLTRTRPTSLTKTPSDPSRSML